MLRINRRKQIRETETGGYACESIRGDGKRWQKLAPEPVAFLGRSSMPKEQIFLKAQRYIFCFYLEYYVLESLVCILLLKDNLFLFYLVFICWPSSLMWDMLTVFKTCSGVDGLFLPGNIIYILLKFNKNCFSPVFLLLFVCFYISQKGKSKFVITLYRLPKTLGTVQAVTAGAVYPSLNRQYFILFYKLLLSCVINWTSAKVCISKGHLLLNNSFLKQLL